MRKLIFSLYLLAIATAFGSAQQYILCSQAERVMDPETGMDAVQKCRHPRR